MKNVKITKRSRAYRGYTSTYNVGTLNKVIKLLSKLRGFKFVTTLFLKVKKIENDYEIKFTIFYSNPKAQAIINKSDIDDLFESIYTTIISNIQKYLGKGSGWIINSVIDHINISKYNILTGNSYIKLPEELNHSKKGLIDIQNFDDNECFK